MLEKSSILLSGFFLLIIFSFHQSIFQMQGYVSVEDALKKADKIIKYPFFSIFFGTIIAAPIITYLIGFEFYWGFLPGFILGGLLALFYSCYITTKWRIWAFNNVTDVHELKKAAVTERIIPKEGSWQEKLEIRTETDKKSLLEIRKRFEEPFKFYDDLSLATETSIYNSKSASYLILFLSLASIIVGIILITSTDSYLLTVFAFFGGCIGLWRFQKLSQQEPQIVLSNEGIKTNTLGFAKWSEISREEVEFYQAGNNSRYYFIFQTNQGSDRMSLEYLDVTPRRLNHLLYVYRHRSELKPMW